MIHVEDLHVYYPDQPHPALRGMSLTVPPGQTVLVSGPTGCGKSTLGLALCGAIPALIAGRISGAARVNGVCSAERPVRATARELGFLLQDVAYQTFTDRVSDEVAFGLENFGVSETAMEVRIAAALEQVGAAHLAARRLSSLSAGERQRAVLAALLALDQPLLMLDEPLAYLDRASRRRLLALIRRLAEAGKGILIFEHRRDLVRPAAATEVCMEEGCRAKENADTPVLPVFAPSRPGPERLTIREAAMAWPKSVKPLFAGVSLTVRAAESVVLEGENGSGKTTLLSMALGLLQPSGGEITTNGEDARRTPPARLAREAALIFQHPDHQLYLSRVGDEVRLSAPDETTAAFELEAMGLAELAHRHPRSLSMGQKRRLTVAAALARRPKLLLLDEPSVGQDDRSLARVLRRLDRFVREGGALLTATHDERVARALGHRVYRLEDGILRESAPYTESELAAPSAVKERRY